MTLSRLFHLATDALALAAICALTLAVYSL